MYDFPGVEVPAYEFGIGLVLFQSCDGEVVDLHDGVTDGGDALKEVLSVCLRRAWEWFDEYDLGRGLGARGVKALDAYRHLGDRWGSTDRKMRLKGENWGRLKLLSGVERYIMRYLVLVGRSGEDNALIPAST